MIDSPKPLVGTYDGSLVALSILIAIFASYAALELAARTTAAAGRVRLFWLAGGAIAMGVGIWSMHYIGMMAFSLPVPVLYDWPTVLLSLIFAILASAVALFVVSRRHMGWPQALSGSAFMGGGIATMHYTGMAAMRLPAMCSYDPWLLSLSVVTAIAVSLMALWLAFRLREDKSGSFVWKFGSAIVMGAAIPAMHYTGMAAARFVPSAIQPVTTHAVSTSTLGTMGISAVTLLVLCVAIVTSVLDQRLSRQRSETDSLSRATILDWTESRLLRRAYSRYAVAVIAAIVALVLRDLLTPLLGHQNPYHAAWFALAFSAWYCGVGPSIVALIIDAFGIWYWFLPSHTSFRIQDNTDIYGLLVFFLFGALLIVLGEATRRITAEAHSHHDRLRGIIDSAMDAIITIDESQRIQVFNRTAEKIFRCSASDVLNEPLENLIPDRYRDLHRVHVGHFGQSGVTTRSMLRPGTLWGLRSNGEEFPLEASISQIEREGKKFFTVILRDITERKHAETQLQMERDRLSLALTTGKMGAYEMDVVRNALWLSPECCPILGVATQDYLPSPDAFMELVHPQDRDLLLQHIKGCVKERTSINHEFRILRPDGKESWMSCQGVVDADERGRAVRHSGLLVDITSRKEGERMVRRFERLGAAARLSSVMAHEINNPLAGVVNLIYLLKSLPGLPPAADQLLVQAEQELERVAHATRQTLGFYRESSAPERIDLDALIEAVLELYSDKLVSKHIHIERVFGKCAPIQGVRGEIRHAISNVIVNAIDSVAKGGVVVVCTEQVQEGDVEIVVTDDGPGVPSGDVSKIFEPFFTTKGETSMGLGLWVAKDIVERHGGSIRVSPRAEEKELPGVTFTIRLPNARPVLVGAN